MGWNITSYRADRLAWLQRKVKTLQDRYGSAFDPTVTVGPGRKRVSILIRTLHDATTRTGERKDDYFTRLMLDTGRWQD
jgi:hypothetical protein